MDERFGALDAIARDQMGLEPSRLHTTVRKAIIFVTSSLRQAVLLAARVIVMSARPGRMYEEIEVDLPHPRTLSTTETERFFEYTRHLRRVFESLGLLSDTVNG